MDTNGIIAHDLNFGIGLNGRLPWHIKEDLERFKSLTSGNIIIMGHNTWVSLPKRPLPDRVNIVITSSNDIKENNTFLAPTLERGIEIAKEHKQNSKIFIIGGAALLEEAISKNMICRLYVSHIFKDYSCDVRLNPSFIDNFSQTSITKSIYSNDTYVEFKEYRLKSWENSYLNLVRKVLKSGIRVENERTGTGTIGTFGEMLKFDLSNNKIPLLTTKRVFWRGIVEELLWFIRGETDCKSLNEAGVHIWDGNSSREALDALGMSDKKEYYIGPMYGYQWRSFGGKVDQLKNCIDQIKCELRTQKHDRRILISAWNPLDLPQMVLAPCHVMIQFNIANSQLKAAVFQRSVDIGLGLPFNIASYALLTHMIAYICDISAAELTMFLGDAHIYLTHIKQMEEQCSRMPYYMPRVTFKKDAPKDIDLIKYNDLVLSNYNYHAPIKMKMAI